MNPRLFLAGTFVIVTSLLIITALDQMEMNLICTGNIQCQDHYHLHEYIPTMATLVMLGIVLLLTTTYECYLLQD